MTVFSFCIVFAWSVLNWMSWYDISSSTGCKSRHDRWTTSSIKRHTLLTKSSYCSRASSTFFDLRSNFSYHSSFGLFPLEMEESIFRCKACTFSSCRTSSSRNRFSILRSELILVVTANSHCTTTSKTISPKCVRDSLACAAKDS